MNPTLSNPKRSYTDILMNMGILFAFWHCLVSLGRSYWWNMPDWLKLTEVLALVPVGLWGLRFLWNWCRRKFAEPQISTLDKVLLAGAAFLAAWMVGCSFLAEFSFPGAFMGSIQNLYDVVVNLAVKCIRMGLAPRTAAPLCVRAFPVLILVAVVNNLAEARLISYGNISGAVFFLVAGLVVGYNLSSENHGASSSAE